MRRNACVSRLCMRALHTEKNRYALQEGFRLVHMSSLQHQPHIELNHGYGARGPCRVAGGPPRGMHSYCAALPGCSRRAAGAADVPSNELASGAEPEALLAAAPARGLRFASAGQVPILNWPAMAVVSSSRNLLARSVTGKVLDIKRPGKLVHFHVCMSSMTTYGYARLHYALVRQGKHEGAALSKLYRSIYRMVYSKPERVRYVGVFTDGGAADSLQKYGVDNMCAPARAPALPPIYQWFGAYCSFSLNLSDTRARVMTDGKLAGFHHTRGRATAVRRAPAT